MRIYCASGKEVESCTNVAHILRIGRESYANLAHILRIDTSSAQLAHLAQNTISQIKELKGKNKALEKRIIDNQSRSMRDNSVFYNVKEDEKFTEEEKVDTEAVLVKFIKEEMKVKSEIRFERVHRMGKAKQGTDGSIIPAPIVAKFSFFKQREEIRRAAVYLRGSKAGVSEQFLPEINAIRKKYWPILKQARQRKRAKMVVDKLFIDGILYKED